MLTWKDISPPYLAFWVKEQKMTRDELAELLGVAKSSINRWMSKNEIPRHRKVWIAKKLNEVSQSQKDHILTDRYGGIRTEASLYTAQEWEVLKNAARIMHMSTDEFQKWAVDQVIKSNKFITEEQLPPIDPDDTPAP
ncbi:hypothetical protein CXU22_03360 [Akkermansia muciniphila]|uniref:HTH cro/C1-type domain-containing protein n=1 Tax=Akkermansia muciniphila TaxID=239935 RepID=A0A2N8HEZ9_9BACT|nr:helix-turn-helix transcriptional regulator [Akkermansia muciniphila]PNC18846.1 hypothetical protein CXU22_03360 [Akkermansia muciniphila]